VPGSGFEAPRLRPCCLPLQAKEVGGQAGDAVEQGANTAADKAEEAGSAAEDYSKTGQKQVTACLDHTNQLLHQFDNVCNAGKLLASSKCLMTGCATLGAGYAAGKVRWAEGRRDRQVHSGVSS
jgi:hypothetical protein